MGAAASEGVGGVSATFTTAGAAAAAQSKPERTSTQAAIEENWQQYRQDNLELFFNTQAKQAEFDQQYSMFLQQQVTNAVGSATCGVCGLGVAHCQVVRLVEVTVIDIAAWFTVKVPVVRCSRCQDNAGHVQRLAVSKLAEAQRELLEEQLYSSLLRSINSDVFRKYFAAALDNYAAMSLEVGSRQWLELPPESLAGCCTVCRRGHLKFLQQEGVLVLVDGLQKMRHFRKAGRASGRVPLLRERLLPDTDFMLWDSAAGAEDDSAGSDSCNTFKADKVLGRSSDLFDQSGIVTLLCRHGFVLAALNMPTGERWAYATYLLHVLMHEHSILPYIMMYDINCRFQAHFKKWVEQHSDWSPDEKAFALRHMQMPVPPFHIHMHMAACQAMNALSRVPAGGTGIGEPTEQMNRFLGLAGVVLQYATLASRALWLEVLFRRWNIRKLRDLPRLLVSSGCRAVARRARLSEQQAGHAARAMAVAIRLQLAVDTAFKEEVASWGTCPTEVEALGGHTALPWQAEVAELIVQLESITWHGSKLLPGSLVQRVWGLSLAAMLHSQKRLQRLRAAHPETVSWVEGSLELEQAVAMLCSAKVAAFQLELERMQRQHFEIQWLQQKIGDVARKEHQKLTKEMQKLGSQLLESLQTLVEWEAQRQRYKQHLVNAATATETAAASSGTPAWHTLQPAELRKQMYAGKLPWGSTARADPDLHPELSRIKQQMALVAYDLRAAEQEVRLVSFETNSYRLSIQQEVEELVAALNAQAAQRSRVRRFEQRQGPDLVDSGVLRQNAWGNQLPPWEASPTQLAAHQQLVDSGAWPAAVAGHVASDGLLHLPNSAAVKLGGTLLRLRPGMWLNDELVNYAMWWLQQRDAHIAGSPVPQLDGVWGGMQGVSCHFFNSFFMGNLYLFAGTVRYNAVRKWTSPRREVLSCSLIVAPCNLNNTHWTLVVADIDRCRILYLDPMGECRADIADAMAAWVQAEAHDKLGQWWDTSSWPRVYLQPGRDIPRQTDGHSCGLYAVVLADCIGAGVPLQHCRMAGADAVAVRARLLDNLCEGVTRFAG
ncbi:hypothetical protein OEZ86_013989 [Tetradesmus obliquus]|nr:hypothetical protein OEZ86_013989 [Tetradesmus obliquus]